VFAKRRIVPLGKIPYVDYPELHINKNESTEMPFRYVKGENGQIVMPEVRKLSENVPTRLQS
jgi:ribosome biogenesis SPOUT family RNA methylase Rps3